MSGKRVSDQSRQYGVDYGAQVRAIKRAGHEYCVRPACCSDGRRNYNRHKMRWYRAKSREHGARKDESDTR